MTKVKSSFEKSRNGCEEACVDVDTCAGYAKLSDFAPIGWSTKRNALLENRRRSRIDDRGREGEGAQ